MIRGLPECNEALVIAPHPDDEALGCGGTIALLQAKSVMTTVAFLTDGERLNGPSSPEIAEVRREEGRECSRVLGCGDPIYVGLPDGELESRIDDGVMKLSSVIEAKRPDLVFSPSPLDYHRDHLAASKIAMRLMKGPVTFRLAFYEVYSTVRFTHLVDITEVLDKKKEAILSYRTSLYGRPRHYVNACLGLNAHRSLFVEKEGYYEAFCVIENDAELEMVRNFLCYRDLD